MPRGKGRKVSPYRNAVAERRPPPGAPRQVERQNLVLSRSRLIGGLGVLSRSRLIGRLGVIIIGLLNLNRNPTKMYNRCYRLKMVRL
jgi:hypothetical protein